MLPHRKASLCRCRGRAARFHRRDVLEHVRRSGTPRDVQRDRQAGLVRRQESIKQREAPVDLNLTPRELRSRDEVRAWFAENVPKDWVKRRDEEESMQGRFDYLRAWQRKLYDAGWAGISWPKDFGGRGAAVMEQVIFIEEMARAEAPPMANVIALGLIGPTIMAFGTPEQKKRYLAKMLSAEEIWCQGFSEPNAGSDLAALSTAAVLDGDHFVVNGQKVWTSYAWAADWCELVVRTDPTVPKHKGLTALLVDMHSPGVEVRGLKQMSGESEFGEIFFRDVDRKSV